MKHLRMAIAIVLLISTSTVAAPAGADQQEQVAAASDPPDTAGVERVVRARASRDALPPTTTTTTSTSTTTSTAPPRVTQRKAPVPKQQATTTLPPRSSADGRGVTQVALAQVGKAYRSGGTGPSAFDCSGLVYYVFNQAGVSVPRLTSDGYYSRYAKVSRDQLQPGDLVVASGHIGIYVGNGQMVHASTPRGGVKLAPMGAPRPFGYVRI